MAACTTYVDDELGELLDGPDSGNTGSDNTKQQTLNIEISNTSTGGVGKDIKHITISDSYLSVMGKGQSVVLYDKDISIVKSTGKETISGITTTTVHQLDYDYIFLDFVLTFADNTEKSYSSNKEYGATVKYEYNGYSLQ